MSVATVKARLAIFVEDAADFTVAVFAPVLAIVALIAAVVFGIGYGAWYVSLVECDHVEDAMERPTRLDTWGEGCMVTLDDGTEVPLSNYRVTEEEPTR